MPKGVICGGAVDGSNQLGEIVTNHAMTARPDGAVAASVEEHAPKAATATSSKRMKARRMRRTWNDVMKTLRAVLFQATGAVRGLWFEARLASTSRRSCGSSVNRDRALIFRS